MSVTSQLKTVYFKFKHRSQLPCSMKMW